MYCLFFKCIITTANVLKDRLVLLLWSVIFIHLYWILSTTTGIISYHNIRILAPFQFFDPTSCQISKTENSDATRIQNEAVIAIIKYWCYFMHQISPLLYELLLAGSDVSSIHVSSQCHLLTLSVTMLTGLHYDIPGDILVVPTLCI